MIVFRLLYFSGPFASPDPEAVAAVVDMHCHTAGIGAGGSGCFAAEELTSSYKFRYYLEGFGVKLSELEAQGDALIVRRIAEGVRTSREVDAAIVLAMDGVIDDQGQLDRAATQIYVPNRFVRQETEKHPELFYGASVNPKRTNAVELLERAHADGAKLIKWLPAVQQFDPGDRSWLPFYRKLAELDLPLLVHVGKERALAHARDEFSDPKKLALALETGVTVIAAHLGSTGSHENQRDFDRLKDMMERYPNLYGDISSLTQVNKLGYLKEALTHEGFRDRLLYGSDFPLINTPLVSPWFFPLNLEWHRMKEIGELENPWDRDFVLKRDLGVPSEVFDRPGQLLMQPEDFAFLEP